MADYYDKAVEYLTKNRMKIGDAWFATSDHIAGKLFSFATPDRRADVSDGSPCGCPTLIRGGLYVASTKSLTEAIRADKRIPKLPESITVRSLPVFAEWQRRIDRELGRTPPVWPE